LQFKCEKEAVLYDNINIRFKGFGLGDCRVKWSKDSVKKMIPDLKTELLDIIMKMEGGAIPTQLAP